MSNALTTKAAIVPAPFAGGVFRRTHSATAARFKTPKEWFSNWITIRSSTSNVDFAFGDAGVMVANGEASVVTGTTTGAEAGVIAISQASGGSVKDGETRPFYVFPWMTHFSLDSDGSTGSVEIELASGESQVAETLDPPAGNPLVHFDASKNSSLAITSGAVTVEAWSSAIGGYAATEASAYPDWVSAVDAATLIRPAVKFVGGSSEKLLSTDATLAGLVDGTDAFSIAIAFSRAGTGVDDTLFSCGTTGSANGRWDITIDASDDLVITRVDSAGNSTTSTYATTVAAGTHLLVITFDGSTPLAWLDRTSVSLSGTAAGDVGTISRIGIGCRTYNTSTHDQFLTGEISDIVIWNRALSTFEVGQVNDWLQRRHGK